MSNFDASPQLTLVKNWVDAYISLDIKNVEPLLSKNFQYHTFPETTDLSKEAKERHIERYREMLSAVSKLEVRIQPWKIALGSQTDSYHPQIIYHEVIEAPGKVVVHVCLSMRNCKVVSDHDM